MDRALAPNAVTLGSWNYRQLAGTAAAADSALARGDIGRLEHYDGAGAYRYEDAAHAQRAADQGGEIAGVDWTTTARVLQCEEAVIKAISVVESGGHSSFWRLNKGDGANILAIMFERHYFSKKTKGRYDDTFPDISWPIGYRTKKKLHGFDKTMPVGAVEGLDIYSDSVSSYLRLIEAYRLDEDAALRSCS